MHTFSAFWLEFGRANWQEASGLMWEAGRQMSLSGNSFPSGVCSWLVKWRYGCLRSICSPIDPVKGHLDSSKKCANGNMASLIASQNVTSVLSHIAGMKSISLIHCCSSQLRKNTHLEAWCVYVAESEKTKLYSYRIQPSRQISSSCLRLKPSSTPDIPIQQRWWPTGQPIAPWGARSGSASPCVELSSAEQWRDPCSAHLAARRVV